MLNLIASLEAVPIYKGPAGPPSSSPTTSFIISNNIFYSNKEMFLRQDRIRQDRGTAKITVRKSLITTSTRPGTSEWSGPQASGLQQEQRPHHLRVLSLPSLHRSSRRPPYRTPLPSSEVQPACQSTCNVRMWCGRYYIVTCNICDHYACIAIHACAGWTILPASADRPPTRPRKTDDRDRRSAAELSTPKHTASPDSSSCLQEGCRSAVHYTKYASAAPLCPLLPPSSSMYRSCRWPRLWDRIPCTCCGYSLKSA